MNVLFKCLNQLMIALVFITVLRRADYFTFHFNSSTLEMVFISK